MHRPFAIVRLPRRADDPYIQRMNNLASLSVSESIPLRGTTLAMRVTGRGTEPVILVHANVTDWRSWLPLVPHLEPDFRVVNYARRYHVPNAALGPDEHESLAEQAEDLAALIERLALGPAHLVGNSSGAFIALLVAQKRPHLVRTLVLEEAPVISLFFEQMPPSPGKLLASFVRAPVATFAIAKFGATAMGPAVAAFARGDDDEGLARFRRGVFGDAALDDTQLARMRENLAPHKALMLGSGLPPFTAVDAAGVSTPTLVVSSANGTRFQRKINERLARALGNARHVLVKDAAHFIHEDNPEAVARLVRELAQKSAPPA